MRLFKSLLVSLPVVCQIRQRYSQRLNAFPSLKGMNQAYSLVFDPRNSCWLSFSEPVRVLSSNQASDVAAILSKVQTASASQGLWAVGWLSYEAASAFDTALEVRAGSKLPMIWFGLFEQPKYLDRLPRPETLKRLEWRATMSESEYVEAFAAVHRHIALGDTYQVNLSFRLRAEGVADPYGLFYAMVSQQAGRYSFFIDSGSYAVCSASPELFFELEGGTIICKPMKGTARRGDGLSEYEARANLLANSEKERAENVMIVDMIRNDLSRIARDRSVGVSSLFDVERFPEVLQMVSEVRATTDGSLAEIVAALFPSASITGAPKPRTMELIKRYENAPRGLYTGSVGIITPDDRAWFNVAIRTAVVDKNSLVAEYGVGSGVVWDSNCNREYNECLLKAGVVVGNKLPVALFETLLWEAQKGFWLLEYHLERLRESTMFIGYPFDEEQIRARLTSAVERRAVNADPLRIRLLLDSLGLITAEVSSVPALAAPYRVALAREPISTGDFRLYHKTTDRTVYETATPSVSGVDDVLLWNERGEVTESRIANVVVSLEGKLYTPPISSGLLPGCFRRDLVERGEVTERVISVHELKLAERVFFVNSLRGMWLVELLFSELNH